VARLEKCLLALAQSAGLKECTREVDKHVRAVITVELLQTILVLENKQIRQFAYWETNLEILFLNY